MSKAKTIKILEGIIQYYEDGIASENDKEILKNIREDKKEAKEALKWVKSL
jgi:hypothetical protein